jgi:hypothetical protein
MTGRIKRTTRRAFTETKLKRPASKQIKQKHCSEAEAETPINPQPDRAVFVPYDETLLDVCRTRWQFGDWSRLAVSDPEALLHNPDRAKIGLMIAAAHFQLGQSQQGHRQLQLALDWGASRRQVMQILISGTHNSLAEANFLLKKQERAREHFREAMRTGGVPGDNELLAHAREARRMR